MIIYYLFFTAFIKLNLNCQNTFIIDFEDLILTPQSYWNGSDGTGGFYSNNIFFYNSFTDWGNGLTSWYGFAYSNMINDSIQDLNNQYSCYAGDLLPNSNIFALSYNQIDYLTFQTLPNEISFNNIFPNGVEIKGMYITNTTYTALTIKNGDYFCKPFGGNTGNDPDWFKLIIKGYLNEEEKGTIEFFLADYRFNNNDSDYIIKEWTFVDLSDLGIINKITFKLMSSDTGQYGMNTPAYFCFDNIIFQIPENVSTKTNINNYIIYIKLYIIYFFILI